MPAPRIQSSPNFSVPNLSVVRSLFALFFCSGAIALIYEVLWQRQFALVFGSAAPATAAVLAAYFTGLAAGSLALGTAAKRWKRPLRAYAVLEVLIGLGAFLVMPLLSGFERIYPWLFERFSSNHNLFFLIKSLLACLSIGIPTFCMGGTLPVLGQVVDHGERRLGISAGLLYVANTAGAGLGALAVPFLFLRNFGVSGTVWLCVGGNLLLALVAWQLDRCGAISGMEAPAVRDRIGSSQRKPSWNRPVIALSLISGLVTFALQVLWNRVFAQVHENSVYSFAVIVAVFIFALAAGAQLARVSLRRRIAPERLIGCAWLFGGVLVATGPWLFLRLTGGLAYLASDAGWSDYAVKLIIVSAAVLFVPITLLGIGFPALMEVAGRRTDANTGGLLGHLLAWNLLGSVAGALLAGFLLPNWFGLWSSMLLTAVLLVVAGIWQLASMKDRAANAGLRLVLLAASCASVWPISKVEWPRVRIVAGERLVAISEGTYGIVAVAERANSRRLKLNNYYVLGGTASAGDERMQAHVPLLLHPSPRRVAVLGLGTGITAGGALFHPIDQVTAVELVPEVIAAARSYFSGANGGVLDHAKTQVVAEDARSYLRGTASRFDVIIGDLVVPWRQGEGALFTLEHFAAARQALAPGGLFCQWLPLFQLSEPEVQILLRTFLSVFPHASVWRGDFSPDQPSIALIGGLDPFELTPSDIERRLRELRLDPLNPQLAEPAAFWMHFVGALRTQDLQGTRINREDRPWIELLGPMRPAREALCVGRRFQAWLGQVKQQTRGRAPNLNAMEAAGFEAGDLMLEFTLLLSEGNQPGARAVQARLQRLLPEHAFKKIFPETPEKRAIHSTSPDAQASTRILNPP
jgi:spermidine synthase